MDKDLNDTELSEIKQALYRVNMKIADLENDILYLRSLPVGLSRLEGKIDLLSDIVESYSKSDFAALRPTEADDSTRAAPGGPSWSAEVIKAIVYIAATLMGIETLNP